MEIIAALGGVNYLAVIVAAVVIFALGALWYSPLMFGDSWNEEMGLREGDLRQDQAAMFKRYGASLILFFIVAWVLAAILGSAATLTSAINWSVLISLGLVSTLAGVNYIYEKRSFRLFLINAGYQIFGLILAAIIIAAWN